MPALGTDMGTLFSFNPIHTKSGAERLSHAEINQTLAANNVTDEYKGGSEMLSAGGISVSLPLPLNVSASYKEI